MNDPSFGNEAMNLEQHLQESETNKVEIDFHPTCSMKGCDNSEDAGTINFSRNENGRDFTMSLPEGWIQVFYDGYGTTICPECRKDPNVFMALSNELFIPPEDNQEDGGETA